ncbi:MAG: triosephosphate isomerase [Bacilli bacterium]|nr:triosephosphate isomerase [Bacilli bacterium]
MKKLFINLKSNLKLNEIREFISNLNELDIKNDIVICPSDIYIMEFCHNNYITCAQNVSKYDEGAYTGEVSASQLKSIKIRYVLVGHFERRKLFNEQEDDFVLKINQAIDNNINVIFCINKIDDLNILDKVKKIDKVTIAYEPIESIGTNYVKNIDELAKDIAKIKEFIYNRYCYDMKIIYGGSVDDNNIESLNELDLDGFIIGNATLDMKKFYKIKEVIFDK